MKTKQPEKQKSEKYSHGVPMSLSERNLLTTNPKTEQFEPTSAEPVRQHYKMAGGC